MKPTVIVGPNGSGKTALAAQMLREAASRLPGAAVRSLTFRDTYGASDSGYYLQQRWNSSEYELVPTVREALGAVDFGQIPSFGLEKLLDKPLIQLSSGELRKFQLVKALKYKPQFLLIDSPFVGLDVAARAQLVSLLEELSASPALELVLVVASERDVPAFAGRIVRLSDRPQPSSSAAQACAKVAALPGSVPSYGNAVVLRQVSVKFGDRVILKPIDWTLKAGEKWALEGPNGSGKSTLLSIICADIPQAYACDVTLFDRRRGTGESIWDIKKHIGFVSPELHRAYKQNVPVLDVVASGLHDRKGLYVKTDPSVVPECEFWMDVFGILNLKDRPFTEISSGEQRLALLARAFVKDPELLILDEPLHGLDDENSARVKSIIEAFCSREGKTLVMVSHYKEDFPPCISHNLVLA